MATIPSEELGRLRKYTVTLGHTSVAVDAYSREDAVGKARKRLAAEHPRMWDVIYRADLEQFQVEETH